MPAILNNIGRIVNQVPGITGVSANGTALVNLPVNSRYHRFSFQVTNNGTAADPTTVLSSVKLLVNGTNMRDISPANIIGIAKTLGYTPALGELPIWFTNPSRNVLVPNDSNSWDLFGQSTFSIQAGIANGTVPGLVGVMEFDFLRNLQTDSKGASVPFLQPMAQHQFLFNLSGGRNDIVTLPLDFPVARLWVTSANARITLLEVYQDGNKIVEGTPAQLNQFAAQYGFLLGGANPFETGAIFDMDQRWWKSLKVANSLNVRVTLSAADNVTIVQETLPGAYQS
jgi:hypothetical protein